MDFTKTEASQDLSGLVRTIVDSVCTPAHQRTLDALDQRFDETLWEKLIHADVLSTAAPEDIGGGGFGVLEQAAILTALGRQLAAVPYLESVVLGAGALSRFGSQELVSFGPVADAFLVPAETDSGVKVFLIAADDPGVSVTSLETTGENSSAELDLAGVEVSSDRLVGGPETLAWLTTHRAVGLTAYQLGVLERALELTAEYARTREQFDRPIGSFQAVAQRLADDYIDIKGLRLTLEQAAWRLSEDLPAEVEVATAAFWAADAGHRVAHTTVHVHGGVGIDTDHQVHRYFITAKQIEFALGGATAALRVIGRDLADTPA